MRIFVQLHLESPYHIGTGLTRPGYVDDLLVKRPNGQLVIPGEHFRGITRDMCRKVLEWLGRTPTKTKGYVCEAAWQKAPRDKIVTTCGFNFRPNDPCVLCRLFGTTWTPRLYAFSDLVAEAKGEVQASAHNRIDPFLGRVPEEFLFSMELGFYPTFCGHIERLKPETDPNKLLEEIGLLIAGLRLVERVGKRSARGWGWCRVTITSIELNGSRAPQGVVPERVDSWLRAYLAVGGDEGGMAAS